MIEFTKSLKFIIGFLILTLMLSMLTNPKVTYYFLLLVLLGMVLVNYKKINEVMGGVFK